MAELLQSPSLLPAHRSSTSSKHNHQDDLQPWTAARCQRLLRQLQSRVTSLRRLVSEAKKRTSGNSSKRDNADDVPQPAAKRTRYTYAQRRRTTSNAVPTEKTTTTPPRSVRTFGTMKLNQCSPATGRVDFKTPLLRKIREQPDTPIICPLPMARNHAVPQTLVSELQGLRRTAPDGHYRIYEAIFTWLVSLLRSTGTQASEVHPKSLLGMCLRKVPATLAEIEAWDRKMAEEAPNGSSWSSSNACLDLYGQLEGFGSTSLGWRPLKIVVRMHAMSILNSAISEGLFDSTFIYLLGEICVHLGCNEEAASIVSHSSRKFAAPRSSASMLSEVSTTRPLQTVTGSLHGKNSPGASFDCLSYSIQSGKLPLSWLSTRAFRSVWASSLESMTANKPVPSTLNFMCTVLEQLASNDGKERWSRQDGREQTLISLAAGISAAAIMLGSESRTQKGIKRRAFRRLQHALDCSVGSLKSKSRTSPNGGFFILALAQYLATISDTTDDTAASRADNPLLSVKTPSSHVQYRQALVLTCSVAQFRGRACGLPCHDILFEICSSLDNLGFADWFREGLRTDGAFVLAQKTKDLRDLAFAERLPAAATVGAKPKTIFSGWRWDEGISEWVMPSPVSKNTKSRHSLGDVEKQAGHPSHGDPGRWRRRSEPGRRALEHDCDGHDATDSDGNASDGNDSQDELDELQQLAPQRSRPRETPTCRVTRSRLATMSKRDSSGGLVAKQACGRDVASGRPRVKVSTVGGLAVSVRSSQGTVVKQLKDVRGPSQKHLSADDDWDELV